ncbi:SDR family oxidoreductase [Limibaculum sp. FT325]|uniref:D-erythronate dehydrogenase n=1 Tax=Thermohalobaculum sediminis TaxID=2939436 RepID=UPI0020C0EF12|nr:D-erythronate dehydrogenase [Limibaculum sediminis]MCL5778088.1 SDR family oxidoreductase [Limibaculum sediminis]
MHVMIIGAAGMLGRKLAERLAVTGALGGRHIAGMTLTDIFEPAVPAGFRGQVDAFAADFADPQVSRTLAARRADVIYHLAAVVSGEAEQDFDKGYRVNLDATRFLLDAIRAVGREAPYRPRLVFTSSLAVFGAPFPERIGDSYFCTPQTSYGTQKAMCELLLEDYTRRGIVDGIGLRLPTICIRPGAPNKAASGFFSNILREPLAGREAILPVGEDVRHWFAGPRSAMGFLEHAGSIDLAPLGHRRVLNMPGLSATVGDELAALREVAGPQVMRLIRREPDPLISRIVAGWPSDFLPRRALDFGFRAETSFREIIEAHIADELGGTLP